MGIILVIVTALIIGAAAGLFICCLLTASKWAQEDIEKED